MHDSSASMRLSIFTAAFALAAFIGSPASADSPPTFTQQVGSGVGLESFERVPSARYDRWLEAWEGSLTVPMTIEDIAPLPAQARGLNGVVLFDYDGDGDTDLFATNGPGADNGLFANQYAETGAATFVDVTENAGVGTRDLDASGACYGDLDNDGDPDLILVGFDAPHRIFENLGDGTFADATARAGLGSGGISGSSCVVGDIDNDGYLDLFVSHSWDQNTLFSCFTPDFAEDIQPNELFLNTGDLQFVDVSEARGVLELGGLPEILGEGHQGASWSAALVDYDLDGDVDLLTTDDQCGFEPAALGGIDRGFLQLWSNDGTGHFDNVTVEAGLDIPGAWMGVSFGDYNRDGYLDLFATNFGDWFLPAVRLLPAIPPYGASRWFYGGADGEFTDPGVGDLVTTPFGWGTVSQDFDNDGDTDIAFFGDLHTILNKTASNPGTILLNEGEGEFTYAEGALGLDYRTRQVHGVASADFNHDGRVDIATTANTSTPDGVPLIPYVATGIAFGSPWDAVAGFEPLLFPIDEANSQFVWSGVTFDDGGLSIELNTTENDYGSISVEARGSIGLTDDGSVNRSGIGAVAFVHAEGGERQMLPVTGGSSHASQNAEARIFGIGDAEYADVEVLWPGGVRNRLLDVEAGEQIVFPEIPCDFTTRDDDPSAYRACVDGALADLVEAGVLSAEERERFARSAFACDADRTTACLSDGRFRVEAQWRDFTGVAGSAKVLAIDSDKSGLFSFFAPDVPDLHVNVLDGCGINGYYWVFAAASTNVEYTLVVADTQTGAVKTHGNALGEAATAVTDTEAFPCR